MDEEITAGPSVAALERKLVTLRQITEIHQPCKLRFKRMAVIKVSGGWQVVVRKRNFKIGDHILFFECDSFIPGAAVKFGREMRGFREEFNGEGGYHIQACMVCNHMSQGHIMEIADFHYVRHIVNIMKEEYGPEEGLRVASMMAFEGVIGVSKWEAPNHSHAD